MKSCALSLVMGCRSFGIRSNLLLLGVLFVNNLTEFVAMSGLVNDIRPVRPEDDAYRYFDVREKREMKRTILQGLGLKHNIDVKKVCYILFSYPVPKILFIIELFTAQIY